MKREPNITEQQAREIVEKMGRRESYTPKSMNDIYRRIGLEPDELELPGNTVTEETETAMADEPSSEAVEKTGNAAEACQQQAAQVVVGGVPRPPT